MLLDQPLRALRDHPRRRASLYASWLPPEEDVFRDGQVRREQRLLMHHRDSDRRGLRGVRRSTGFPFHSIRPPSRSTMPATIFIRVDLPAPFSPSNRCTSPADTLRLPSWSAVTPP